MIFDKKTCVSAVLTLLVITAVVLSAGCGGSDKAGTDASKGTVHLGYVNWSEGVAMTNLLKVILEDEMGYEVEMTMADVAPIYTSIARGDIDVFMDAWLPVTHQSYMEEYGDDLVDLGHNYEGAAIGLVAPAYLPVDSIEDLNSISDELDGQIIGIDSGAGIMKKTEKVVDAYGLDLKLVPSSGPAMTASLKNAIDKNENIVVTGWKPHWKFARFDLKFLDDPQKIYGETENIHAIVRRGLDTDMPDVAAVVKNFKLNDQQLGGLMDMIRQNEGSPEDPAREWMEANRDLINGWLQ